MCFQLLDAVGFWAHSWARSAEQRATESLGQGTCDNARQRETLVATWQGGYDSPGTSDVSGLHLGFPPLRKGSLKLFPWRLCFFTSLSRRRPFQKNGKHMHAVELVLRATTTPNT